MLPTNHILIADDEAALRALLARLIARIYPSVMISTVTNGDDALDVYRQRGANLVLTDHNMPGMNGLMLIATLRAESATLPIIMVSSDPTVEPEALRLGASAFLPKSTRFAQFRATVTQFLPV